MATVITMREAPVLREAMLSDADVKIVQGPVGSGKTTWGFTEIYRSACQMPRCKDGVRRSRWLVVRETEGELKRGPIRSFQMWWPEDRWGPIIGHAPGLITLRFDDVELELEFFAFADDSVAGQRRLRSTEYTGIYINEGQYRTLKFVKDCQQRTGRYPSRDMCPDFDQRDRLIMDMNAPPMDDHWVHYMRGDLRMPADMPKDQRREFAKPANWAFFVQPPVVNAIYDHEGEIDGFAINPDAENLKFQNPDAIMAMVENGAIDDIKRDYMNMTVQARTGRPRYAEFKRGKHVVMGGVLQPVEGLAPIIGWDPGVNGAVSFWQNPGERWFGLGEIYGLNDPRFETAVQFGREMLRILSLRFPWWRETGVHCWGDPFGTRQNASEETWFNIVADMGLAFQTPAVKDSPSLRWETGKALIGAFPGGEPKLQVCGLNAPMLAEGLEHVSMKVKKADGGMRTQEIINKDDKFADIVESAEYAWWGGGEANEIVVAPVEARHVPFVPDGRGAVFSRGGVFSRGSRSVRLGR